MGRRIGEKEEEFMSTKKNFSKAIDAMQASLEIESKGKCEALRMKKKLESDVGELEISLEHANAANQEIQRSIKKYHQTIRESQTKLEDEARAKDAARDCLHASERRANSMHNALEEARTLLEQADRSRRITEQELSDTNEQLSDLTCNNQAIAGAKRKLESEMQTLHGDMDEMASEAQLSDEKAKKAMVDAARLADASKNLRKSERRIKELAFAGDEDRKNHERMQALIDQLQGRIKTFKKQIEEAEEIAAMNLAKYRQAQANLGD